MADGAPPGTTQLQAFARQVYPQLDRLDYYQLLRVPRTATVPAIRASYYQISAQLHPDRYHTLSDAVLREQLETIFARITEAYRVVTHPDRRTAYDRALSGGKTRFDPGTERAATAPRNPEDTLNHPQAKTFFRLGLLCLAKKDWKGAVMNFNFARNFEPNAPVLAEKLAEAQAGLKASGPPSSGGPPSSSGRR